MKRRVLVALLSVLCVHVAFGDDSLAAIVKAMSKDGMFMSSAIGVASIMPDQYKRYLKLKELASEEDLLGLLSNESGAIRSYACLALSERGADIDWYRLALACLDDPRQVVTMFGCIVSEMHASDVMLDIILPHLSEPEKRAFEVKGIERQSELEHVKSLLLSDRVVDEHYAGIRTWALRGDKYAIFALAKYGRAEDYELVMKLKELDEALFFRASPYVLNDALKPYFRSYAESILEHEYYSPEWSYFYGALARYHDAFSLELFRKALDHSGHERIKKYHLQYMLNAVSGYSDGFYDDLLLELWSKHAIVDCQAVLRLYVKDKEKTVERILEALEKPEDHYSNTDVLDLMLELAFRERISLRQNYIDKLPSISVSVFKVYFKHIDRVFDEDIASILVHRLEGEMNGHIAIPIFDRLLALHDHAMDERLESIYEKNKARYLEWTKSSIRELLETDEKS